jgi:hypothetical protein
MRHMRRAESGEVSFAGAYHQSEVTQECLRYCSQCLKLLAVSYMA